MTKLFGGCFGSWWTHIFVIQVTIVKLSTVTLGLPQPVEPQSDSEGSSLVFLKPGASYKGRTAATSLESSSAAVAVLVILENWSRWSMVEPEVQVTCGKSYGTGTLPDAVMPGFSEMALFEKGPGFTGVCGVLTYRMETPSEDLPHYVQVMWSVPYDYNTYNAYLAVGIANEFLNSTNLFNELYYHIGPFERVKAGNLAEYTAPELKVKLRGTMQPDTYKPIVTVSIMPVEEADSFQYASQNAAILQNDPAFHFAIILCLASSVLLFN